MRLAEENKRKHAPITGNVVFRERERKIPTVVSCAAVQPAVLEVEFHP